jgi:hypothetical protein
MFMQFVGGGIGHKASDNIQQQTPSYISDKAPNLYDNSEEVISHNTQDHAQMEGDIYVEGDPEEVDTDEEADYGYTDDRESECRDSKGEESEGKDSEGEEGNDDEEDDV